MHHQQTPRLAFLGLGLMGRPMALRLLSGGSELTVWNRDPAKTRSIVSAGAAQADTPEHAIRAAEGVILMLTDAAAIRETVLTDPAQRALVGRTILQMGTISPSESREVEREVTRCGGRYLEAPVLGSIPEAADGELIVMVGSTTDLFTRWLPVLERFGPNPQRVGDVGRASALKLALNQLIATITTAYATSLGMVRRAGVDPALYAGIVRDSALYAPTFDKKLDKMLGREFVPANFPARHLLKDVRLSQEEAAIQGLFTPHLAGVAGILERAVEAGFGRADYSALSAAIDPDGS
jgi:3-hydroxyisobutyrate dehydrogenase